MKSQCRSHDFAVKVFSWEWYQLLIRLSLSNDCGRKCKELETYVQCFILKHTYISKEHKHLLAITPNCWLIMLDFVKINIFESIVKWTSVNTEQQALISCSWRVNFCQRVPVILPWFTVSGTASGDEIQNNIQSIEHNRWTWHDYSSYNYLKMSGPYVNSWIFF